MLSVLQWVRDGSTVPRAGPCLPPSPFTRDQERDAARSATSSPVTFVPGVEGQAKLSGSQLRTAATDGATTIVEEPTGTPLLPGEASPLL